ncbi:MAG TPA: response regulator transcription factor [Actinomycetaceae bacterium]|nr:response regulator transcription factor [Actinomycetaceae bacterium]
MKIIIAEDSTLLRAGLVSLLERLGHQIIAEADDAPSLLSAVDKAITLGEQPDIVITDVRMPPENLNDGLEAAHDIRHRHPELPILVLSQYLADADALTLLDNVQGGIGYLLKDRVSRVSDLTHTLDAVASGGVVIDPDIVSHLLGRTRKNSPIDTLTDREREVLAHMASGLANAEIANTLVVSDAAVAKHINSIFAKLGLTPDHGHRRVRAVLAYLHQ